MTKIRPIGNRVLAKRLESAEKTPGGIYIPDQAKERMDQAEVIAVGPGRRLDSGDVVPVECRKGDTVLFGSYAGHDVKIDGEKFLVLSGDDIIGVLE